MIAGCCQWSLLIRLSERCPLPNEVRFRGGADSVLSVSEGVVLASC